MGRKSAARQGSPFRGQGRVSGGGSSLRPRGLTDQLLTQAGGTLPRPQPPGVGSAAQRGGADVRGVVRHGIGRVWRTGSVAHRLAAGILTREPTRTPHSNGAIGPYLSGAEPGKIAEWRGSREFLLQER